jgi:hypothetical protein
MEGIRERISEIPEVDLRSTAMEDLWRVRRSGVEGGSVLVLWALGTARSTRRTEAPQSASKRPANGPDLFLVYQMGIKLQWWILLTC